MAIIVRIQGGLGNQLFQYAFGRGVSSRFKTKLILDTKTYEDPKYNPHKIHRPYGLGNFRVQGRIANDSDMIGFVWLRKHYKQFDWIYEHLRMRRRLFPFYYPERTFAYDPDVMAKRRAHTYFDGDWTTEKYFKHIEDEIRKELALIKPLSEYSQKISDEIKAATNPISLHVRRGDYITDPTAAGYHGVCSMDYYERAISYIAERVQSPHFFVFSDDYAWSRETFSKLPYPTTCVDGKKDYEDMMLMSQCKNHIIANSTLGWWGAWLDPHKDKIVIAPKVWFANAPKADTRDLIPEEWVKM